MKKWLAILSLCLILAACSSDKTSENNGKTPKEEAPDTSEPEVTAEKDDTDEEQQGESGEAGEAEGNDKDSEKEVVENKGLVEYMPKRAIKKTFLLEEFEIVREVKAVKGNRMLETISFGDVLTLQVSEWTPTKLTMLFNNSEGIEDVTIDNYPSTSAPEVYIDKLNEQTGPLAWTIVDEDLTLTMPAGTYEDVLVIEQTIVSETSNQKTITRFYYGKGLGVIKEETITKDDKSETTYVMELNSVE